ncbi:MAG: SRPBCC domain-containing protein [Bacteroidetes bacterium]|nr:SRPBCC domain-containing protein [Bacteroidota bacterium]
MSEQKENQENELVITRELDAPRDLVWKAWTDAEALAQWWGPKGFDITVHKLEFKPGGQFHYNMKAHNGFEMWGLFTYKEINAPEKLVFINSFSNEKGEITRAPFFDGKWPLEILNVMTLSENNGKTTLTLKGGPVNANAEELAAFESNRKSMQQGFAGTFEKLEQYLEKNK